MTAFSVLFLFINFCLLSLLFYFLVLKKESSAFDSKDLDLKISQLFSDLFQKITEKNEQERDKIQTKLIENFSLNQEKIQKIESNLENFLKQNEERQRSDFEKHSLNLQSQFEKLKNSNLENLQKIQVVVTEKLEKSILNLSQVNTENFKLLNKTNQERLDQINLDVQKRLDENFARNLKSFDEVATKLGGIQSTAQKMIDSTKSIDKLNNIFARTSSQSFGNFGEQYLESLLRENLADGSWSKQVLVPNSNNKIDFLIRIEGKKIGIDSKFPLTKYQDFLNAENSQERSKFLKEYLKSVLSMAKDISNKYLEVDFVNVLFLYLPSDSMYNEVVNNTDVVNALQKLKVTPVSPATIFPLILIISQYQFKMQVTESADNIIQGLSHIRKNIDSFKDEFRKLGDKIRQAQDNYDKADKSLMGVEKNIYLLENTKRANEQIQEKNVLI
jgi:DNA recombination protein RmuC